MNRVTKDILAFGSIGAVTWAGYAYLEKQRKEALDRHREIREAADRELEAERKKTARMLERMPEAEKMSKAKSLEQMPGAEGKKLAKIVRDQVEQSK